MQKRHLIPKPCLLHTLTPTQPDWWLACQDSLTHSLCLFSNCSAHKMFKALSQSCYSLQKRKRRRGWAQFCLGGRHGSVGGKCTLDMLRRTLLRCIPEGWVSALSEKILGWAWHNFIYFLPFFLSRDLSAYLLFPSSLPSKPCLDPGQFTFNKAVALFPCRPHLGDCSTACAWNLKYIPPKWLCFLDSLWSPWNCYN